MIKHKLPVLGLGLILLITSCKKTDVQQPSLPEQPAEVAAVASASIKASEWKTLGNWSTLKSEKFSTHNSSIADSSITSSVTGTGLVLAYVKNGTTINALPFQEKGTKGSFWYYQVSNGSIIFSCDDYSGSQSLSSSEFKYFVFTPEQLAGLEAKGYSKVKLMQMTYEEVAAIAG